MEALFAAPDCIRTIVENYRCTPVLNGESGSKVYLLDQGHGPILYLKWGQGHASNDVIAEFVRLRWLAKLLPVPQVRQFGYCSDQAWLLTTAAVGSPAYECLSDPNERPGTVRALADFLRKLHSLPLAACPFNSDHEVRMAAARRNIEANQVDKSDFQPNHDGWSAENIWTEMLAMLPMSFDRVVTHGDFSLGNVFLEGGTVTGCIDVGRLGAADPYQDLAILGDNLKEFGGEWQTQLFSEYGIADPDIRKVEFYLCLDEFF